MGSLYTGYYRINFINLRHQYGVSFAETQTFLLYKGFINNANCIAKKSLLIKQTENLISLPYFTRNADSMMKDFFPSFLFEMTAIRFWKSLNRWWRITLQCKPAHWCNRWNKMKGQSLSQLRSTQSSRLPFSFQYKSKYLICVFVSFSLFQSLKTAGYCLAVVLGLSSGLDVLHSTRYFNGAMSLLFNPVLKSLVSASTHP